MIDLREISKCSICGEVDKTCNMIRPCKCNKWVHRQCLDKRRASKEELFDQCPDCKAKYETEKIYIPDFIKIAWIVFGVLIDFICMACIFIIASATFGWILTKGGITLSWTSHPFAIGATVLLVIIGIIFTVMGVIMMNQNGYFIGDFYGQPGASLEAFAVIGVIVVLCGSVIFIIKTSQNRIALHRRKIKTKELKVKDIQESNDNVFA